MINQYKALEKDMDGILSNSPLKINYLADKIGVGRTHFYNKRKNQKFTVEEIETLINEISKLY